MTEDEGSATADDEINFRKAGQIAWITLNRPDAGNAVTRDMHRRLRDIWIDVREDSEIRAVVLGATGERHFCTGADLKRAAITGRFASGDGPLEDEIVSTPKLNRVWKPVVAAVNGLVNGFGLHLVVDADIVVASTNAVFMDTHVSVGQVGGMENLGLARRMPIGAALQMTLMGKHFRMGVDRAHTLGLVDEVVAPRELEVRAAHIAECIARNSPRAVSLSQQAIWHAEEVGYRAALEHAWGLVRMHRHHPDSKEGPAAFIEHRDPVWTTDD